MERAEAARLKQKYGGAALVTGGARGIGRAFAEALAAGGFDVLLVDRETEDGEALANELRDAHGVDVQLIACDLTTPDLADEAQTWAERYEIGVLVANAGIAPVGAFVDVPLETHLSTLDLNARATLIVAHVVGRAMVERGRGAIVVVSSASAISGAPYSANYAGTKAYGLALASSLWGELKPHGIDVLAVCPGLTDTQPVRERGLDRRRPFLVPFNAAEPVARGALRALGRQPVLIPALSDRLSSAVMSRLLPRSWTLSLVRRSMEELQRRRKDGGPG